jgi:hypothetical protein
MFALVLIISLSALVSSQLGALADVSTPTVEPTDQYPTYSVLSIGKPTVPKLNVEQERWLHRIYDTPAYRPVWRYLRFSMEADRRYAPFKVFDGRNLQIAGAHIIGAPCDLWFDPFRHGIRAIPSDVACAEPTPAPITPLKFSK